MDGELMRFLENMQATMKERFDAMDKRLGETEMRLGRIEERLNGAVSTNNADRIAKIEPTIEYLRYELTEQDEKIFALNQKQTSNVQ